ncbi:MAG: hypothetical protein WA821_01890 [Anaerolineales bacterium]
MTTKQYWDFVPTYGLDEIPAIPREPVTFKACHIHSRSREI